MNLGPTGDSKGLALPSGDWRAQIHRLVKGISDGFSEGASSLVASGDEDELLRAALRRKADQYVREQENIEAVAHLAEEKLKETPPPSDNEPSGAFMHRFQKEAVNATSDDAREMFARVLAGEFQKPGSFSFPALDALANLDQKLATSIDFIAPYIGSMNGTLGIGIAKDPAVYEHLIRLQSRGLMLSSTSKLTIKNSSLIYAGGNGGHIFSPINIQLGDRKTLIIEADQGEVSWQSYLLTDVGREIMSLRRSPISQTGLASIVDELRGEGGIRRISLLTAPSAPSTSGGSETLYERP